MLKRLLIVLVLLFIGCSSKPQAPIVINIAPSFPPQYFPNNSGSSNRNIGNSYEENNNIQEINTIEKEREDEIDENEYK